MKADRARQITDDNKVRFDQIIDQITSSAGNGYDSIIIMNLSDKALPELMENGYKVGIHVDNFNGTKGHIITW